MRHVRRRGRAPAEAHRSAGLALPKSNGKGGAAGLRLLQNGDPGWKSIYGSWLHKGVSKRKAWWPTFCHGFLPGRRREEATSAQYVMADRLRRLRIWYAAVFHDLTNALASSDQGELAPPMTALVAEEDVGLFHQRLQRGLRSALSRRRAGVHAALGRASRHERSAAWPSGTMTCRRPRWTCRSGAALRRAWSMRA